MLLHYLIKVEAPKMHVNTNSAFNVIYEIAVKCTKLHWHFHKMFWWTTPCLKKTSHLWLAITLTHMNGFWYFLAEMLLMK